ncbi:MAG: molybdopterin-binding protein [Vicinamibacterales bacterium]
MTSRAAARSHIGGRAMGQGAPALRVGRGQCALVSTSAPLRGRRGRHGRARRATLADTGAGDDARDRPASAAVGLRVGNLMVRATTARDTSSATSAARLAADRRRSAAGRSRDRPAAARRAGGAGAAALPGGAGQPPPAGCIFEINRLTLGAIVARHGGVARRIPIARDTLASIEAALDAAAAADVIVVSGGSSAGDHDVVRDALARDGALRFHGIAVKPGKPTAFGLVRDRAVFGMPGNPTACLSNGYLLLVPFLRRLARLPAWEPTRVTLPLARRIVSPEDRHQFFTVRVTDGRVEPAFKGSGEITSLADADGFIEIPAGTGALDEGVEVRVTLIQRH